MAARPGQADKGCKGDDAQTELHPGTKPIWVDREVEQTGDKSQQNAEETRHNHTPDKGYCRQDRFGWKRKLSHTVSPACRFAPDYFLSLLLAVPG